MAIRGSCLCGEVAWEISEPPESITHCHCSRCRKSHGAAFGTYMRSRAETFRFTTPTVRLLQTNWYRRDGSIGSPMVVLLRFNQPVRAEDVAARTRWVLSRMDRLPVASHTFDAIVSHGIWNLARSGIEFRRAAAEAARAGRPGAGLFVFTFSRNTLGRDARPVAGESFVFTEFSGDPQCFLTEAQLLSEMSSAGFEPLGALIEHNRPGSGQLHHGGPVIYEGMFRLRD